MKKITALLMAALMLLSLAGCGTSSESETNSSPAKKEKTTIGEAEKNQKIRQAVVNKCCSYSNCDSIKGLEIGTQKLVDETDDEWIYEVSGTYYPVDKYGDLGDNYKFDITLEVNKSNGYAYASSSNIRRNY